MKKTNFKVVFLLASLSAFPPLSTDMYLPAMPLLQKNWHQSLPMINLTLSGFFLGFCLSMLFYGPLSDRYGRKPPLMVGISIYTVASLLAGFANDIHWLIALRILQGLGSASSTVIVMAITKDLFEGCERQRILAYMGVIIALAPMCAPVLGGVFMTVLSWHWIFFAQAVMGVFALAGVFLMKEPLKTRSDCSIFAAMGLYLELFHNRRYLALVFLFSLIVLAPYCFIGAAKDIYINGYGISAQRFGYFFAFNALSLMAGSFACSQIQKKVTSEFLMCISFLGMLIAGILMYSAVITGPWGFAVPMGLLAFFFGLGRPPSNHLVLQQVDHAAGTASSLMVFFYFILGAIATWFISLDWPDTARVIAVIAILSNAMAFIGGVWVFNKGRWTSKSALQLPLKNNTI